MEKIRRRGPSWWCCRQCQTLGLRQSLPSSAQCILKPIRSHLQEHYEFETHLAGGLSPPFLDLNLVTPPCYQQPMTSDLDIISHSLFFPISQIDHNYVYHWLTPLWRLRRKISSKLKISVSYLLLCFYSDIWGRERFCLTIWCQTRIHSQTEI